MEPVGVPTPVHIESKSVYRSDTWRCPGCGTPTVDAIKHVRDCDRVDGTGKPLQRYCHDPRHDTPCPLPCYACEQECDVTLSVQRIALSTTTTEAHNHA